MIVADAIEDLIRNVPRGETLIASANGSPAGLNRTIEDLQ